SLPALIEKLHSNRLRPRLADAAIEGILDREAVQRAVRRVDLEHKGLQLGVLPADRASAEAAGSVGGRGANPALHQAAPASEGPRGTRVSATPARWASRSR